MKITESGKKKYAETKRIIRDAMIDHQLVLFVGAGASVDAGMPLWPEAIRQIAEKLNLSGSWKDYDSLIIPQYYHNARGNKEYTQLMRDIFRYNDKLECQPVHKAIIAFDTDTIITTNYDHLIEQAAEDNGVFLQVVSQNSDLPYRKFGKELIKMHGDFEHDNFVLKEDDYLHYHKNFKLIENYVKSLIGTATVLFIGYSLSDPDVKHIFSWVKDILDEHFQRAYLIITGKKENQHEEEYFKHLGVNIIYATDLFDEKDISLKDCSSQLLQTLYYLLDNEEEEKSIVDSLYESLKPFSSMNFTYKKYIEKAFRQLHNKINEHITLRVDDNYIEHSDDRSLEEDRTFLDELDKAIKQVSDNKKMQVIADTLMKSVIKGTRRIIKDGERLKEEINEFSVNLVEPEWIDALSKFNYKKLYEIKDYNSKILSENKPELYLLQAYICSFLGDYLSAYYCLDDAATSFYRKREYAWYFISLWNKRNIAQIITVDVFYHLGIDKELFESIKQDLDSIDLDKTLKSLPDLGHEHNRFLRDLKDFKFASDLFYDGFSDSTKASAQASESYFMFVGLPAYEQIRKQVYDYYSYGIYNYLLVDRYRENNEIFNLFTRSMFTSASAPDKDTDGTSIFGKSGNIHVESLNTTDIHLVLRYMEVSRLRKLFNELGINIIEISDDCQKYLREIANYISGVFNFDVYNCKDIFWRYLCFVSHTKIEAELATEIVNILLTLEENEFINNCRDALREFTDAIYVQELYNDGQLCRTVQALMIRMIRIVANNSEMLTYCRNPIISLLTFCKAC